LALALVLAALLVAGCEGGDGDPTTQSESERQGQVREGEGPAAREKLSVEPVACPPGLDNCRSASGRIVYVERVDPDGDGDAHFVLASRQSVTAPGISVIDVERELRPHPLPGLGDEVSAAGPVYRGSYGQRQIQATEVRVGG
jgi:hypothetical protein